MPRLARARPAGPDRPGAGGEDGFTLTEMLVAFALIALGTVTALQVAEAVGRQSRRVEAALVMSDEAEAVVTLRAAEGRLRTGLEAGRFSNGQPWTLEVADIGPVFGWRNLPPTWRIRLTSGGPGGALVYETILAAGLGG